MHFLNCKSKRERWYSSYCESNYQMCCEIKCSTATLSRSQTRGSVGGTDVNRWLALVAELYCNYPSVSSQSWCGCAHPYPFAPMWLMTCAARPMRRSSKESSVIFCSGVKASFQPPLEPWVFCDLMSPLENSPLQVEKHVLDFDLGGWKSCWEQIQNLLDDSTGHSSTKYKH